jgi:hypothetical protein
MIEGREMGGQFTGVIAMLVSCALGCAPVHGPSPSPTCGSRGLPMLGFVPFALDSLSLPTREEHRWPVLVKIK